mmetsp:Transcript_37185/g.118339  ORF Transcript_37185/g.118339 Transcript_37185/m.118339 type:complete len:80 (+) Transcript_37185:791-1030(+)
MRMHSAALLAGILPAHAEHGFSVACHYGLFANDGIPKCLARLMRASQVHMPQFQPLVRSAGEVPYVSTHRWVHVALPLT